MMRVVSCQPAATEIAYALGAGRSIVGVSHECERPAFVKRKPIVSRSIIDPDRMSSRAIDRAVTRAATSGKSLYRLDWPLIRSLKPDVLLTQSLCDV